MNLYPLAGGPQAQPEVRHAVKRFRRLPIVYRDRPLLYWLLGSGTPPYKMAPSDAVYGPPPPALAGTQSCGNCRFAYQSVKSKTFICSQIAGSILPQLWCKLWRS